MKLMPSQRILYLPGTVSRIIVSALFLSSSLMITIDRWSRMVDITTLWLQARPLQFTGGEILSEIFLIQVNFGSGFISLCHLFVRVYVADWWSPRIVYVQDVWWEQAVALAKAEQFSQDDNCVTFEFGVTSWRHVTRLHQKPISHSLCVTLGFEQRLRFAKIVSPLKTQSLTNRVLIRLEGLKHLNLSV